MRQQGFGSRRHLFPKSLLKNSLFAGDFLVLSGFSGLILLDEPGPPGFGHFGCFSGALLRWALRLLAGDQPW